MRKMELKRMRKRILRMWMKRKVAMRMTVRIINTGRICGRVIRLWGMKDRKGKFLLCAL